MGRDLRKLFSQLFSLAVLAALLGPSLPVSAPAVTGLLSCPDQFSILTYEKNQLAREQKRVLQLIAKRRGSMAYPEIPALEEVRLPKTMPAGLKTSSKLSAGLSDPLLERARELNVFEDFKPLSDAAPLRLPEDKRKFLVAEAERKASRYPKNSPAYERAYLKHYITRAYDFSPELKAVPGLDRPRWKLHSEDAALDNAFAYTEKMWDGLLRETKPKAGGSLIETPYPILVPGGRFQETYYWDTYFGMKGLLATGRLELAQMQTENMLSFVHRYGFVPNGNRDYYLTRSQPPFLSSAVREVFEASLKQAKTPAEKAKLHRWLKERAYPLVQRDYDNFWMQADSRLDPKTGLNHHWDDANLPRPERHGHDNEKLLGKSYRDVRGAAESGLDFTAAHEGETNSIAPVLLNSMLHKTESDLAWMAKELGLESEATRFSQAAKKRASAMRKHLWNEEKGRFDNYNLRTGKKVDATTADTFAPLFVGMASPEEAGKVRRGALPALEREFGVASSDLMDSSHQWDGTNGWAPQQIMAVGGLQKYGHDQEARRIARGWTNAIAKLHKENGAIYERVDVASATKPARDEKKYPTQEGFLWTNSSFSWMLLDVLKTPKSALP